MRILIVASGNSAKMSPFVKEQAESLIKKGVSVDFFFDKRERDIWLFTKLFPFKQENQI